MPINISMPNAPELKPRIVVFGVGGAGGNAVNNMIVAELDGAEFVVANTDAQALANSRADRRLQLGTALTQGLGAGARPEIGRGAAEEAAEEIAEHLRGSNMVFITAGMGGGTGTGAAPVIARIAAEMNILVVGVVTKPFNFEGTRRMRLAEAGIEELQRHVDTLIVIPNQNLFRVATEKTTFADAFRMADNVLHAGVRGITDLMVLPGLINLDFADVQAVMSKMGRAMMGTGEAEGENRAVEAAERAIANPLLDDVSLKGARGVLVNIIGGSDLTLHEVDEAANRIRGEVDPDANIIVGSTLSEKLTGRMRVLVVATGVGPDAHQQQPRHTATVTHLVRPTHAQPRPTLAFGAPAFGHAAIHSVGHHGVTVAQSPLKLAPEPAVAPTVAAAAMPASEPKLVIPPAPEIPEPVKVPALAPDAPRERAAQRRPGLFERIAAVARGRHQVELRTPIPVEPASGNGGPSVGGTVKPVRQTVAIPAPAPGPAKPATAKSPTPPATATAPGAQEDLLEIPTFLRRQAN
jgi:cell division protein FtsZ